MGKACAPYEVQYQAQWVGRFFSLCVDETSRERFYLVEEPTQASGALPDLPGLAACAGGRAGMRTWSAPVVAGETLKALRESGGLTGEEVRGALLAVVDALQGLGELYPPIRPAYIDPACVVRGERGWVLDYVRLALVDEARRPGGYPPGVQAVGGLLRWLGVERSVSSLGELRGQLERGELGALLHPVDVGSQAAVAAAADRGEPVGRVVRPAGVVAWGAVLAALLGGFVVVAVGLTAGFGLRGPGRGGGQSDGGPAGPAGAGPGVQVGGGRAGDVVDRPDALPVPRSRPAPVAEVVDVPVAAPVWAHLPPPPPVPAAPPGALESLDATAGGIATAISLDGRWMGYAWVYQARSGVYLSLDAFNQMFHHFYRWHDNGDGTFTIWDGTHQFKTANGGAFDGRLWLDMDSSLRSELGVSLVDWSERQLHFVSNR